jgi:hypothetical protein
MIKLLATLILCLTATLAQAEDTHYPWVSLGYSQDIGETSHRGGILSGGLFPTQKESDWGFGFQSYLEGTKLNEAQDTGMVYTLGIEPTLHWKWFYGGLGLAVSDRTTAVSGTLWNFTFGGGARYQPEGQNWFGDVFIRHRSHCAKSCGIETDKVNSGMTSVNFSIGITW